MESVGTLHKDTRYVVRVHVGEATIKENGEQHTFMLGVSPNQSPFVTCEETGYHFSLSWSEILKLAIKAGITGSIT